MRGPPLLMAAAFLPPPAAAGIATAATTSRAAAAGCGEHINNNGNAMPGMPLTATDSCDCEAQCTSVNGSVGWTFVASDGRCYCRGDWGGKIDNCDCWSALLATPAPPSPPAPEPPSGKFCGHYATIAFMNFSIVDATHIDADISLGGSDIQCHGELYEYRAADGALVLTNLTAGDCVYDFIMQFNINTLGITYDAANGLMAVDAQLVTVNLTKAECENPVLPPTPAPPPPPAPSGKFCGHYATIAYMNFTVGSGGTCDADIELGGSTIHCTAEPYEFFPANDTMVLTNLSVGDCIYDFIHQFNIETLGITWGEAGDVLHVDARLVVVNLTKDECEHPVLPPTPAPPAPKAPDGKFCGNYAPIAYMNFTVKDGTGLCDADISLGGSDIRCAGEPYEFVAANSSMLLTNMSAGDCLYDFLMQFNIDALGITWNESADSLSVDARLVVVNLTKDECLHPPATPAPPTPKPPPTPTPPPTPAPPPTPKPPPQTSQPNILVFMIDDMGYSDLAPWGSQNHSTPHVDALVASGTKFTQWISSASICTPSRASYQTGRYPIRTGCIGSVEKYRVILSPSNPGGLDPAQHTSLAHALKKGGYATGMSGKWHIGINSDAAEGRDHRFTPTAHGYDDYLGAPWTNSPMCEMDSDGISSMFNTSWGFCYMTANTTVVQMPLRLENFTGAVTGHALRFIARQAAKAERQPWYFFMSYFHVHTPLFTNRSNRGRSKGGAFGDTVEELDDSIGEVMGALHEHGVAQDTLIFLTSDNGPYQEEGWALTGRTNIYDDGGALLGRLKGGKGQLYEGGVRMPGAVVWPGVVPAGVVSDTMVSTMDIFPTALAAAGVDLGPDYIVDGKDMGPVIRGETAQSQHDVFLHYCGFEVVAARVWGRWKVFWATTIWYTRDPANFSICTQCCNGIVPGSTLAAPGHGATELCGCEAGDLDWHTAQPIIYDMTTDRLELHAITSDSWPAGTNTTYAAVVAAANSTRDAMTAAVHPSPDSQGAGTCTRGLPSVDRQDCCPGCTASPAPPNNLFPNCSCACNDPPSTWVGRA